MKEFWVVSGFKTGEQVSSWADGPHASRTKAQEVVDSYESENDNPSLAFWIVE